MAWVFFCALDCAVMAREHERKAIRFGAEQAIREGCELRGGEGEARFLAGFDQAGDRARWRFAVPAGFYRLELEARAATASKRFVGRVSDQAFSGKIGASREFVIQGQGLVELPAGEVELEIGGGWGHYEIAAVFLRPWGTPSPPDAVPGIPANPQATAAARSLLRYLAEGYGRRTLSGQMEEKDLAVLARAGVEEPAILASDLMRFSPSWVEREAPPGGFVEKLLGQAERGHLLSLLWHWNAPEGLVDCSVWPWWRGFYREGSTFDVARALEDPSGSAHALLIRDIDAIAEVLRPLSAAGVPVLWRPLHEADGGWFWWGAKGPEAFKRLWRLLYERLTGHHGLHHLLWCVTIEDPAWYPGDDVVDVVCVDVYPEDRQDALSDLWLGLHGAFAGRKPIALGEFPGVPEVARMRRLGVHWAWFCSWHGDLGPGINTAQQIRRTYGDPAVITRSGLPVPSGAAARP